MDLSKVKVFGCTTYYNNLQNKVSKFEPNSRKGIFLGIKFNTNCYIIMDREDQRIHLVREATFLEDEPSKYTFRYLHEKQLNNNNFTYNNLVINYDAPYDNNNNNTEYDINNDNKHTTTTLLTTTYVLQIQISIKIPTISVQILKILNLISQQIITQFKITLQTNHLSTTIQT